jgi:hypothetical protein
MIVIRNDHSGWIGNRTKEVWIVPCLQGERSQNRFFTRIYGSVETGMNGNSHLNHETRSTL